MNKKNKHKELKTSMENREIKFRVVIETPDALIIDKVNKIVFRDNGTIEVNNYLVGFKLLQYTRQKDKNNNEIYEGDIIKDNSGKIFIQGLCGAKKIIKRPTNVTTNFEWKEIISNIYENPEILKKNETTL